MSDTNEPRPMMTAEQVLQIIPMSRRTLIRLEARGLFPKGVGLRVGNVVRKKYYYRDEVADFQRRMDQGLLKA